MGRRAAACAPTPPAPTRSRPAATARAIFNVALLEKSPNREDTIFRSKAVGEPPLMLGDLGPPRDLRRRRQRRRLQALPARSMLRPRPRGCWPRSRRCGSRDTA